MRRLVPNKNSMFLWYFNNKTCNAHFAFVLHTAYEKCWYNEYVTAAVNKLFLTTIKIKVQGSSYHRFQEVSSAGLIFTVPANLCTGFARECGFKQ